VSVDVPLLECRHLACGYGARAVLRDVNLTLGRGESAVLLGPNGSGKSTLLKTLSKTLPVLDGEIRAQGADIREVSHSGLAKRVAYVPQEELPPFRFTVRQVVLMGRMPLSAGFFDTPADISASDEAMREADCLHLADRPITEISGGERQRALIARALAQDAPVLLLDEPTSHLDIGHQLAIVDLIRKLKEQGKAILAAMHDLNLAQDIGERAILLHEGRVAADSKVEEVLANDLLDKTYGVPFHRMKDETGRLRVFGRTS
jgi:iron complex transport system ATP-binding protein